MIIENKSRRDGISFYYFAFLLAAIIIIFYAGLNTTFNKEDVDDAWMLSLYYNAFVKNLPHETTFGGALSNLKFFGITQAFIYSRFPNIVGWTKGSAHLLSSILIMLSGAIWFFIFRKLYFSLKLSLFAVLLMVWSEPFFREATLARPEALTFFLVSMAFLAFISGWYLPSGFLAMIAFENHPKGMIVFIYILCWIVSDFSIFFKPGTTAFKKLLFFLGGIIIGSVYYISLHYSSFSDIHVLLQERMRSSILNTVLYQYFFGISKYYRHLAELIFFSACLLIFIGNGSFKKQKLILILLTGILAANFLNPGPNYHYAIYYYPSFIILSLAALEKIDKMMWGVSFLFVLFLAYYLFIFYRNHDYDFKTYSARIATIVPADNLPVIGSPNEWFAFKDREFYPATYTGHFNTGAPALYLIKEDNYRNGYTDVPESIRFKEIIASNYTEKPVKSLKIYGETYEVAIMSRITETVSNKQTNVPLETK